MTELIRSMPTLGLIMVTLVALPHCTTSPDDASPSMGATEPAAATDAKTVPIAVTLSRIGVCDRRVFVHLEFFGPDSLVKECALPFTSTLAQAPERFVEIRSGDHYFDRGDCPPSNEIIDLDRNTFLFCLNEGLLAGEYEVRLKPGAPYDECVTELPKLPFNFDVVADVDTSWHRFRIEAGIGDRMSVTMLDE